MEKSDQTGAVPDFSHYSKRTMRSISVRVESGGRLTDGMLADAVRLLSPPLLPGREQNALLMELDDTKPRKRGRPRGKIAPRLLLAKKISAVRRHDLPSSVQVALVERLTSGQRYTELQRARPFYVASLRSRRESLIRFLYRELYEILSGAALVDHPAIERVEIPAPEPGLSLSERALTWAQQILRDRLHQDPPSIGRMRNIVSRNSK